MGILTDKIALTDSVYLAIVGAFFVLSLAGMALLGTPQKAEGTLNASSVSVDITGGKAAVPAERFRTVCLGSGCIPAVDDGSYVPAAQADWLDRSDSVVAVSVDGEDYAFPLGILRLHAVVNTHIAGRPVAVTYSPYSGVPRAFSRDVGDRRLTFEHSGKLYRGNMLMQDRETGTVWSQFEAEGLQGELAGKKLSGMDAHIVRWGIWKRNNLHGKVLSRETGIYPGDRYIDDPYRPYRRSHDVPFYTVPDQPDPKTVVHGLAVGGEAVAYPEVAVESRDIVHDDVGGTPVLVVQDAGTDRILAFRRAVNGTELTFRMDDGSLVDEQTGSTWDMSGESVLGPMNGKRMERLELTRSYVFVWRLFHPDTQLYGGQG